MQRYELAMLVDTNSVARRHYHTNKRRTVPDTISTIQRAVRFMGNHCTTHLVLCFDGKDAGEWRRQIWPDYKADREERPEDLTLALRDIYYTAEKRWFAEAYRGYEADDVIATLVHRVGSTDARRIMVFSSDKDVWPLLKSNQIQQLRYHDSEFYVTSQSYIEEEIGLSVEVLRDYFSLVGDSVDNVPGVKGCGPKTAVKWLRRFGTIEGIVNNIDSLDQKQKVVQELRKAVDTGLLDIFRKVLSPRLDCPVKWQWGLRKPQAGASSLGKSLTEELFGKVVDTAEPSILDSIMG